jgi:uncharacterized peroxidase-related enzyme
MQPWIEWTEDGSAQGKLARVYAAARERAGKVFGILRIMSQNPEALQASIAFYVTLMKGESPLSRSQREMLATVVSRSNGCHY